MLKRLVLISTIALMALAFWLNGGERSLAFAKPWITQAINNPDAPYSISIADVTVDWGNVAMLGKIRLEGVTFAKRDGSAFAVLPEVFATIDPIGFLPSRHLLHTVLVRKPLVHIARNAEGVLKLGIQDAPERMPASTLMDFFVEDNAKKKAKPAGLPFHQFIIEDANLTFNDEISGTNIVSSPFNFQMRRRQGSFEAVMATVFTVDDAPVKLSAGFRMLPSSKDHVLSIQLEAIPTKLICIFSTCGDTMAFDGPLSGTMALGVSKDFSLHGFSANLSTTKATVKALEFFAQPLKLGKSNVVIEGDWAKQEFVLKQANLTLEDTTIVASATARKEADGWYATVNGEAGKIDITKVYKYWPLTMAPDSRAWVTSKLKSGYAAKGTLKLVLTPEEFAADTFSDAAVSAMADARDITFEYLPGFPLVEKMNGIANFTGTTVKVEGGGGTLLAGTKLRNATLWVPDLNNPNIPMEATVELIAPAVDAATMLSLKHFAFDDALGLDPAQIRGHADAKLTLKFNAFSNVPNSDPSAINLGAVDYDITTNLIDVSQNKLYGGYDARAINAKLTATNAGFGIAGSLGLGEAGINDFTLNQKTGEAMKVTVKNRSGAPASASVSGNDFSLVYQSGEVPAITLRGKRIDATPSYGGSNNGLLANFPAMKLDVDVGELLLSAGEPLRNVVGRLYCTRVRCESADIVAQTSKGDVKATISSASGARRFLLSASDAGSFLKALDVTERMTKGALELRGSYDDKKSPPQFNGRLFIRDFTLKNSQILGRILSIGSLTGLSNVLTGDGIAFEKLATNITLQSGVVALDKGAANGAAIGITVAGTVNTNTTKLDLKGVVVPAYALNSILGKIPVIGLLAGSAGEGLIAFNYSVTGSYNDAKVGVNPLSGLTPGFLRGIFSIFDDKTSDTPDKRPATNKPVGENQPSGVQKR